MDRDADSKVTEGEFETQPAEVLFLRFDANASGGLERDEFVAAARKPTLDDLNGQLRELQASGRDSRNRRRTAADAVAMMEAVSYAASVTTRGLADAARQEARIFVGDRGLLSRRTSSAY